MFSLSSFSFFPLRTSHLFRGQRNDTKSGAEKLKTMTANNKKKTQISCIYICMRRYLQMEAKIVAYAVNARFALPIVPSDTKKHGNNKILFNGPTFKFIPQ